MPSLVDYKFDNISSLDSKSLFGWLWDIFPAGIILLDESLDVIVVNDWISEFYVNSIGDRPRLMEIFTPPELNHVILNDFFDSVKTS